MRTPYVGLRPFEFDEADLFYGRGEHIAEMARTLRTGHFLAVIGASGSGKSSLVRAGLLPAIAAGFLSSGERSTDWRFVTTRPGRDPYKNLLDRLLPVLAPGQSLDPALIDFRRQTLRGGPRGLVEVVNDALLPEPARLVVLIDQFEEIFRFLGRGSAQASDGGSNTEQRDDALAFVDLLLATAAERDRRLYVVLTMRSEYLGECEAILGLSTAIAKSQFLAPRMTREQIQDVIERPLSESGSRIEPAVVTALLNSLGTAQDQLPRVEHVLLRIWDRAGSDNSCGQLPHNRARCLTLDHYRAVGRFESALDQHAESLYQKLAIPQKDRQSERQRVAERLFRCLTDRAPQGALVRRLSSIEEVAMVAPAQQEVVIEVVKHFLQPGCHFLVATPAEPLNGQTTLDVSHESLLRQWDRLKKWWEQEAEAGRKYKRLADAAALYSAGQGELLTGLALDAAGWFDLEKPTSAWAERYAEGQFANVESFLDLSRELKSDQEEAAKQERREREETRQRELQMANALAAAQAQRALTFGRMLWAVGFIAVIAVAATIWALYSRDIAIKAQFAADVAAGEATRQAEKAKRQTGIAEQQKALADVAARDAKEQKGIAEQQRELADVAAREAKQQAEEAQKQKGEADIQRGLANVAAREATRQAEEAQKQKGEADIQRGLANVAAREAEDKARELASTVEKLNQETLAKERQREVATQARNMIEVQERIQVGDFALANQILSEFPAPERSWAWNVLTKQAMPRRVAGNSRGRSAIRGARDEMPLRLPRHSGPVRAVTFNPANTILASAGDDSTIRLWRTDTWQVSRVIRGHRGAIQALAFCQGGKSLASAGLDRTVRIWDVQTGKLVHVFKMGSFACYSLASDPDGSLLLAGGGSESETSGRDLRQWNGKAVCWNLDSNEVAYVLGEHSGIVRCVAYSEDGKQVVTGGFDKRLIVWDAETGNRLQILEGHPQPVFSAAFSLDGEQLVSIANPLNPKDGVPRVYGAFRLWDSRTGVQLGEAQRAHETPTYAVAFASKNRILTGGDDQTVRLWDVETRQLLLTLRGQGGVVVTLAVGFDGKVLAVGDMSGLVTIWDGRPSEVDSPPISPPAAPSA